MGSSAQLVSSDVASEPARAITLAILAMGGEGGGVLADWIVDLAEHCGYLAQLTSIPGVAQRTGATIYYVELFPESSAGKKLPVLALMPVPGAVDIVIASELMEAGRAIQREFVSPNCTTLIASTNRVYSMTEKIALGDGRVDSANLMEGCAAAAKKFVHVDFSQIAEVNGSVISAALFGALAAARVLPFPREQFEESIRRGGVGVPSSMATFAQGYDAANAEAASAAYEAKSSAADAARIGPRLQPLAARIQQEFPPASHEILFAAIARLADYQDLRYAEEFLNRLAAVHHLDLKHGDGKFELLRETARYLALWMSYEDASRVADLKLRRTRFHHIREESHVKADQVVQITEYLHPQSQEIADALPAALGRALLNIRWLRDSLERLTRRGQMVRTTSLHGFLMLVLISTQRRWRRKSLRFQREQVAITEWLRHVCETAPQNYALAVEIAQCPRLIKGYGETHIRGSQNFNSIMGSLPAFGANANAAATVRNLREAALADDTGVKLSAALQAVCA